MGGRHYYQQVDLGVLPGNGRKAQAPCGHAGEVVIGTFIQCLRGCESFEEEAPEIETCPYCDKSEVDTDYSLDPEYYLWNPQTPLFNRRCWSCGGVWAR